MKKELEQAQQDHLLVNVFRGPLEGEPARGYVVYCGPNLLLLCVVASDINFDGFQAMRLKDVTRVKPHPYTDFEERALLLRGASEPRSPDVDITSTASIIASAARVFPFVAIHREVVEPDACFIGRPLSVADGLLQLEGISPAATWYDEPDEFRLDDITRVDFGGRYEDALFLVDQDTNT